MNSGGPYDSDPSATQPLPRVASTTAPPGPVRPPKTESFAVYGNLGAYLLRRFAAFAIDVPLLAFAGASFAFAQLRLDTASPCPPHARASA